LSEIVSFNTFLFSVLTISAILMQDLLKKTHQCAEIIRVAKDRQENEANKAASILLEELEMEKNREESKRAAAARKREKKKRKKAEKKGGSGGKLGDDDEEEEEAKEETTMMERGGEDEEEEEVLVVSSPASRLAQEETKEKTPEIMEEVRDRLQLSIYTAFCIVGCMVENLRHALPVPGGEKDNRRPEGANVQNGGKRGGKEAVYR
jgi:hypothetical protein